MKTLKILMGMLFAANMVSAQAVIQPDWTVLSSKFVYDKQELKEEEFKDFENISDISFAKNGDIYFAADKHSPSVFRNGELSVVDVPDYKEGLGSRIGEDGHGNLWVSNFHQLLYRTPDDEWHNVELTKEKDVISAGDIPMMNITDMVASDKGVYVTGLQQYKHTNKLGIIQWLQKYDGVAFFDGTDWKMHTLPDSMSNMALYNLEISQSGSLTAIGLEYWAVSDTYSYFLVELKDGEWTSEEVTKGLSTKEQEALEKSKFLKAVTTLAGGEKGESLDIEDYTYTQDGTPWVNSANHLVTKVDGEWKTILEVGDADYIYCVLADGNGVWVATYSDLKYYEGHELKQTYKYGETLFVKDATKRVHDIVKNPADGKLWFLEGTRGLIKKARYTYVKEGTQVSAYKPIDFNAVANWEIVNPMTHSKDQVEALYKGWSFQKKDGTIISFKTNAWGKPDTLVVEKGSDVKKIKLPEMAYLTEMAEAADGSVWILTTKEIFKLTGEKVVPADINFDSKLAKKFDEIAVDHKGGFWVGINKGYAYVTADKQVTYYHKKNSELPNYNARGFLVDKVGKVWISHGKGVSVLDNGTWIHYDKTNGLGYNEAYSLYEDAEGNVYTFNSLGMYKFTDGKFEKINDCSGGNLLLAQDGTLWVKRTDSISHFDGQNLEVFNTENAGIISGGEIMDIYIKGGKLYVSCLDKSKDASPFTSNMMQQQQAQVMPLGEKLKQRGNSILDIDKSVSVYTFPAVQ
ncbi:hypothetical protein V6R21_30025 [Limibacter armeniacum]|uniref:hypothetical protein n=1 Tax=Limibacter armeniacum TaxID=466084 RepID=UPI002FE6677B